MAVTLLESFDGWSTPTQMTNDAVVSAALGNKWWQSTSGTDDTWEFAAGYTGNGLRKKTTIGGFIAGMCNTTSEVYFGFRYKPADLNARDICTMYDSNGSAQMFILQRDALNRLIALVIPTTSAVQAFTTAVVLTTGSWSYIEIYFKLSHTVGRYDVRVNGILAGSFTGDTQRTTSAGNINWLALGSPTGGNVSVGDMYDDLYVVNPLTAGANSYLGDTRVRLIRPNGNGTDSDWVGSDGDSTDNYLLVDEQNVTDSDYVQSTNDADRDLYAFENPTITGDIKAVQLVARAADLNPSDPKDINLLAKLSASELSALAALDNTMKERWTVWETKPGGGTWTSTDLNNTEFGYEQVDA